MYSEWDSYLEGVPDGIAPPDHAPALEALLPPSTPWAIHGTVFGPNGWADNYLTIDGGSVSAISSARPTDVRDVETGRMVDKVVVHG